MALPMDWKQPISSLHTNVIEPPPRGGFFVGCSGASGQYSFIRSLIQIPAVYTTYIRSMAYTTMDEVLLIRIDTELKRRIKKAARSDHRSISNYVRWVMKRELDKQGIIVEPRL